MALEREEFFLNYQAQIAAKEVVGAEVLLRWRHPELGLISPAEFVPLAEECGLIVAIGNWVLESACRKLQEWQAQPEFAALVLSVNVSVQQFNQPDFVRQVLRICEKTAVNPQRLKLELTESIFVEKIYELVDKIALLKAYGICFSLDDFGTGYSALSYLSRLPFDQLKIDQSFVRNLLLDPNDAAITKNIIDLAATLNLQVIAEGVETREQMVFLRALGCEAFQGYFFSKPLSVGQFEGYVRDMTAGGGELFGND